MTDWRDTPCWILNFNNLDRGFRDLLLWLRRAGMARIAVLDNASTYQPLIDFYDSPAMAGITLVRSPENLGFEAMWKLGLHLSPITPAGSRYILTDPDCVPDKDCPLDLVRKMHEVADRYAPAKVGPALRVDNLHPSQAEHAQRCESDYWLRRVGSDCWDALIDTTFALYSSGWERWPQEAPHHARHLRLDFPYVAEHRPWYEDAAEPSAEARFYRAHVAPGFSTAYPVPIPEVA